MPADRSAEESGNRPKGDGRHVSPIRLIRRPWAAAAALLGALAVCGAVAGLAWAGHTGRPAYKPAAVASLVPVPAGKIAAAPPAQAQAVPNPTGLVIPSIGIRTRLIRLGLTSAGTLQVPSSTTVAGWYTGSPPPGATGSAVIAGHIDSYRGPGIFYRLHELKPGSLVYVQRGHGTLAVFKVTAVRMYLKSKFPTADIYGPVPDAQLRLITCGGTFDYATGHYLSNVIAFASLQP
jgi:LPXTG-site transpeptidase (sortase) family protein